MEEDNIQYYCDEWNGVWIKDSPKNIKLKEIEKLKKEFKLIINKDANKHTK